MVLVKIISYLLIKKFVMLILEHILKSVLFMVCASVYFLGHFSQHSSEILFCLTTLSTVSFCEELRDYASDVNKIIHTI